MNSNKIKITPRHVDLTLSLSSTPFSSFTRIPSPSVNYLSQVLRDRVASDDIGRKQKDESLLTDESMVGLPPAPMSDKEKLNLCIEALIEYLEIFGFDRKGQKTVPTLDHWHLCSMEIGWIKFLKYKFSAFFAWYLGCDLPLKPFNNEDIPQHLIGGRAGRFIRSIITQDTKRARQFAVGLLFLKKGLPRPDQVDLDHALMKTFSVLTTVKEVPTTDLGNVKVEEDLWRDESPKVDLTELENQVRRTVQEVFDGHVITDEDLHKPYAPSVKANYVSSRRKLGTFGDLISYNLVEDLNDFEYSGVLRRVVDADLPDGAPLVEVNPDFESVYKERYTVMYERIREALGELSEKDGDMVEVKLVALAEALKVRVISKGPGLMYFLLKPVQKFLHTIMRKHKTFKLTGEPVSLDFLKSFFLKKDGSLGFDGKFLSVDYASATDLLNPTLSRVCADEICRVIGLPPDLSKYFRLALTGHKLEKPTPGMEKDPRVTKVIADQLWGQLMGSIVSFIVLCIVNAAICRYSYERGTGSFLIPLNRCPLLVNGDDGLLVCNESVKKCWEQLSSLGGLQPSVGKVYFHDNYLNINSASYWYKDNELEHIPYVNMGLVMGLTRSEGGLGVKDISVGEGLEGTETVGSRHWELMNSCPPELTLEVHRAYLRRNREFLKMVKIPWYVPESMGGVGLKPFLNDMKNGYLIDPLTKSPLGPSERDLKCVRILLQGVKLGMRQIPTQQPVQARQVWLKSISDFVEKRYEVIEDESLFSRALSYKMNQEDLFNLLDSSTYYFKPTLVAKALKVNPLQALRANERAWRRLNILAQSRPNLPGFEVIKSSYVYRRAKFVRPERKFGRMMNLADVVKDPDVVVSQEDIIVMDVEDDLSFEMI